MPRKKKPPQPQTYAEYVGFGGRTMRQRAMEAGCRTVAEMVDWVDKHYGDSSQREQNRSLPPPPYRRPAKP
jgi:succinate dehydrogenase/fumarate reductase flavoprotein subunit